MGFWGFVSWIFKVLGLEVQGLGLRLCKWIFRVEGFRVQDLTRLGHTCSYTNLTGDIWVGVSTG